MGEGKRWGNEIALGNYLHQKSKNLLLPSPVCPRPLEFPLPGPYSQSCQFIVCQKSPERASGICFSTETPNELKLK